MLQSTKSPSLVCMITVAIQTVTVTLLDVNHSLAFVMAGLYTDSSALFVCLFVCILMLDKEF